MTIPAMAPPLRVEADVGEVPAGVTMVTVVVGAESVCLRKMAVSDKSLRVLVGITAAFSAKDDI
jgi:hypothetical protein